MHSTRRSPSRPGRRTRGLLLASGLLLGVLVAILAVNLGPTAPSTPTRSLSFASDPELERAAARAPADVVRPELERAQATPSSAASSAPASVPTRAVRGRVVADGEAVADAEVALLVRSKAEATDGAGSETARRARTGRDGTFVFDAVPGDAQFVLKAAHAGFAPLARSLDGATEEELVLELAPDARIRARITGEVVLEDGSPAAGADVAYGRQSTRADGAGKFELEVADLASADAPLVARHAGLVAARIENFGARLTAPGGAERSALAAGVGTPHRADGVAATNRANVQELHGIRLVLGGRALAITGRVLDADGRPAKGWRVELRDGSSSEDAGRTDRQGRFVLGGLAPGAHVLRARGTRPGETLESDPIDAGARDVELAPRR